MKLIQKLLDFVTDYSPEREKQKRLTQAELDLVENECALEYYSASVPMLKARVERLRAELNPPLPILKVRPGITETEVNQAVSAFHFRRAAR
jgi:hypothetical protein